MDSPGASVTHPNPDRVPLSASSDLNSGGNSASSSLCRGVFLDSSPSELPVLSDCLQWNSVDGSVEEPKTMNAVMARKMHKADREKHRRDCLNEHFNELVDALESERPKIDKASILGDAIQRMRELSAEVENLRTEQALLLDESKELTQEKYELGEEKTVLESELEQLQGQLQRCTQSSPPWTPLHPAMMMMMGGTNFPYALPVPQNTASTTATNGSLALDSQQASPPQQQQQHTKQQFIAPQPYITLPVPPGVFIHPALHSYYRPNDARTAYFPYTRYAPPVSSHPTIERPLPQYPPSFHHVPGYPNHGHPSQLPSQNGSGSWPFPSSSGNPFTTACNPGQSLESNPESVLTGSQDSCHHVHTDTTLQLQTPAPCTEAPQSSYLPQDSQKINQAQN